MVRIESLADEYRENIRGQTMPMDCPPFCTKTHLTERELEALNLAAFGYTSKGIARQLSIAEITAKKHLQAAREALGARNTTNAVCIATGLGLIKLTAVMGRG